MNKILKILLILYILSLHILVVYLISKKSNSKATVNQCPEVNKEVKPEIQEEPKIKISTVYILPHPPDFMEGRNLRFNSYKIVTEEGKKKVIFSEILNGKTLQTKVDSEAIKWR